MNNIKPPKVIRTTGDELQRRAWKVFKFYQGAVVGLCMVGWMNDWWKWYGCPILAFILTVVGIAIYDWVTHPNQEARER